jgi:hypothetical protein
MAKDANPQDQNDALDFEAELANINFDELSPEMQRLITAAQEKNANLKAQLDKRVADRKPREAKSLIERLDNALKTDVEIKGLNKAAVKFVTEGDDDITSDQLLDAYARMLETNPGVTVDRKTLQMSPTFMVWAIRLYNAPQVRALVPPKEAGEKDSDTDES